MRALLDGCSCEGEYAGDGAEDGGDYGFDEVQEAGDDFGEGGD